MDTYVTPVTRLKGPALRYMLAQALEYSIHVHHPTYGLGHRIQVVGMSVYFRPDKEWSQLGPILDQHWREITNWLIECFGPNWRDDIDGFQVGLPHWFCIALIGARLGNVVALPDYLHEYLKGE